MLFVFLWRVYSGARWRAPVGLWREEGHAMCEVFAPPFSRHRASTCQWRWSPQFWVVPWITRSISISFLLEFTWRFLQRTGWSPRVLVLLRPLYARLTRVFKIGSSFGEPFGASDGVGQGCSLHC